MSVRSISRSKESARTNRRERPGSSSLPTGTSEGTVSGDTLRERRNEERKLVKERGRKAIEVERGLHVAAARAQRKLEQLRRLLRLVSRLHHGGRGLEKGWRRAAGPHLAASLARAERGARERHEALPQPLERKAAESRLAIIHAIRQE